MASRDFGLARYEFKRANGKGRVFKAFQTPSALVRATRADTANPYEAAELMAYYSAQAAGIVGQMGVDLPPDGSDLDRALALFDAYQFREVPLDDDGNPVAEGDVGPDPTGPSSPASAS